MFVRRCDKGRGVCLLTARRLKSFKCVALVAVVVNLLLFLSLAWRSLPKNLNGADLSLEDQKKYILKGGNEVQTDLGIGGVKQKGLPDALFSVVNMLQKKSQVSEDASSLTLGDKAVGSHTSACSYRTAVYMSNRHIELNQQPFVEYVKGMVCIGGGDIAVFQDKFVRFKNVLADASKITNIRKGGEKIDEVWNQKEDEEYFKLDPGYFKVPCTEKPDLAFARVDHLSEWAKVLECYNSNRTDLTQLNMVRGTTLAIQRYEYVNLYHTMTDFYNAFVLMLIFGIPPSKLNILAVDAHPVGTLDPVWFVLFGKFLRAGRLEQKTVFENLIWGLLGYFSPLNEHDRSSVPYLDEFREFFLSRHNISTDHVINCAKLNVLFIWRRDYVAHPRNPQGEVVRKFENEDEMVQEAKETLGQGANVQGMQLDAMNMPDQLQVVAKADILIGMHGAGLSHILFLPATSGVIEFKPEYSNPALQHFKSMARWRHLPYTIWHNFDPNNERASHKTYIPRSVVKTTINDIYKQICPEGNS